jgi:L-alanine-DL-glutamate epimerase-like enolase superfamily enzyme
MKLTVSPLTLQLRTPFRVAHGVSDQRRNVLVTLQLDGLTGYGEAAAVPYYGDTQESLSAYLQSLPPLTGDPDDLETWLAVRPPGPHAAQAALDLALHDLWGKRLGQPLVRLFGLAPAPLPPTSFTISIDTPEEMARAARASAYPVIKVKLGPQDPEAALAAIRRATDARLRVDANAGWTPQQALELIPRLEHYDLELVEQPLPVGDVEAYRWLHEELRRKNVKLPIYADESVKTAADVARYAGAIDGVVIKLMKTGGLREALRAIHTARAHGLGLMLSCMVESSLGVTAAAHLAPLCDFLDLDGPLLIANDPFEGLQYQGAHLRLPETPGLGVAPRPGSSLSA